MKHSTAPGWSLLDLGRAATDRHYGPTLLDHQRKWKARFPFVDQYRPAPPMAALSGWRYTPLKASDTSVGPPNGRAFRGEPHRLPRDRSPRSMPDGNTGRFERAVARPLQRQTLSDARRARFIG